MGAERAGRGRAYFAPCGWFCAIRPDVMTEHSMQHIRHIVHIMHIMHKNVHKRAPISLERTKAEKREQRPQG